MGEVVDQVRRVAPFLAEIDAGTQQQAAGIGQIGKAVAQGETMTQQNAALVEESSAAAKCWNRQAGGLTEAVGSFKLA